MGIEHNIEALCTGVCLYWQPTGRNGFGKLIFADAVELLCRWEDKNILFSDQTGKQLQAKSVVHILQDVKLEGYMFLGTLADLDSYQITDPLSVENAYPIKRFDKSPAISDPTVFLRKAYLTPYGGMS